MKVKQAFEFTNSKIRKMGRFLVNRFKMPIFSAYLNNRIVNSQISTRLVNGSKIDQSASNKFSNHIVTPQERWSYAVEFYITNIPIKNRAIKFNLTINHGEIGILQTDSEGKTIEERIISQNSSQNEIIVDCTNPNLDKLIIRNTFPYGASHFNLASATLVEPVNENTLTPFPGFGNFEISKEDLELWSEYYGSRVSNEMQFMRSKWLSQQKSKFSIQWINNIQLSLLPQNDMTRALVVSGYYEPLELATFEFFSTNSKIILDVGSNIGIYSLSAATINPNSKVYAIEPSKRELSSLIENLNLNRNENIEALNIALGEFDGNGCIKIAPKEIAGHNHIVSTSNLVKADEGWEVVSTQFCKLDSIRLANNLVIDLIKIDVEGHELSVLKGATTTLTNDKPVILLELSGGLWTNTHHSVQVIGVLKQSGYKIFDLDKRLGIWKPFTGWRSENNGNILCIHADHSEVVYLLNNYLISKFNKSPNGQAQLQKTNLSNFDPIHIFCHSSALAINEARLAHLDTLGINFENKKILEVGGGIGLHTPYFLSQNCEVTFSDSRLSNLKIAKQRLNNLANTLQINLDDQKSLPELGKIDIVYCYGTLYHLSNPLNAISLLASTNANMILLETCVDRTKNSLEVNYEPEDKLNPNQASSGYGARPTRNWIEAELKKHWKYVYYTKTQPAYPDFPENWNIANAANTRSIFIGSNSECKLSQLTQIQPFLQSELVIDYHMESFDSLTSAIQWINKLVPGNRFMISLSEEISMEIHSTLILLKESAVITTLSPCLDKTWLICGRTK